MPTLSAATVLQYPGVRGPRMKQMVSVLLLILAPVVFAAPKQNVPAEPGSQASTDNARPNSNRATSHRRHARRHRTGGQHHRRRTTAKSTNP